MNGLQTNLESVVNQIALQEAALLDSVSKAQTSFEAQLTGKGDIQKMYRSNIKMCDEKICQKERMLIQMEINTSLQTTTTTKVVSGGEKWPKHYILLIDESGSMKQTKLFQSSSTSIWAKAMEFILDFCKSSSIGE